MVDEVCAMKSNNPIRVGFLLPEGHWLGGKNYMRNLFAAIQSLPRSPISPAIFTGARQGSASTEFPGIEIVSTSLLDSNSPLDYLRRALSRAGLPDILLRRTLQRNSISILSHAPHLGRQSAVKTIGWIPDFQHVHLPEFFTSEDRKARDEQFLSICSGCDKVIVSSETALGDLQSIFPQFAHKAELLRFVASPVPFEHAASLAELQRTYRFDQPYLLLPNQFWAHKNHRVVIRALQILKTRKKSPLVLATGSTQDYRNPAFFQSLTQFVVECKVQDNFRILGEIPFQHLAGLMENAVAFLNPSKYEGWSTSVEEAKSTGKQIILSDIPVHVEQAPARGIYFPAEDADALADSIFQVFDRFDATQDMEMQRQARIDFPRRQLEFGEAYHSILMRTLV
jgi:glycosyltransferase involved in cell wall biosynthesis